MPPLVPFKLYEALVNVLSLHVNGKEGGDGRGSRVLGRLAACHSPHGILVLSSGFSVPGSPFLTLCPSLPNIWVPSLPMTLALLGKNTHIDWLLTFRMEQSMNLEDLCLLPWASKRKSES